jgi:hypothetical protein
MLTLFTLHWLGSAAGRSDPQMHVAISEMMSSLLLRALFILAANHFRQ